MTDETECETVRAAIETQVCPWCHRGPFQVLAKHTIRAHQISAEELRRIANLSAKVSLCSPEHAEESRERLCSRPDREDMSAKAAHAAKSLGLIRVAKDVQLSQAADRRKRLTPVVLSLCDQGELVVDIARRVGANRGMIREILAENDRVDGNGRKWRNDKFRQRSRASMLAVQRKWTEESRCRQQGRLKEFLEAGGDSKAVGLMAERWGVTRRAVNALLRRAGCPPSDPRRSSRMGAA